MKYFLVFGLLFFISCSEQDKKSSVKGTATDQTTTSDSTSFTTLQWIDSVNTPLGKINEGQVVEVSWRFRNTGNKPLVIQDVQAGCGCTVADRPKQPVAPGEEGVIKAKFDSKNQGPTFTKSVTVTANTQSSQTHYLTFTGEVIK